jgi:hypothetical protein
MEQASSFSQGRKFLKGKYFYLRFSISKAEKELAV